MSGNESWRTANARLAWIIPVLVVGIAISQVSLDGFAADAVLVFCASGLIACVVRMGLNVRADNRP